MLRLSALVLLCFASSLPQPALGQTVREEAPAQLSQQVTAVSDAARNARDALSLSRKQMIPLVIARAELMESLRIQREELRVQLKAARAAFPLPANGAARASESTRSLALAELKAAQAAYGEVLRLGGLTSADADRLRRTEEELERLLRTAQRAARRAAEASAEADEVARRLRARARVAAWTATKSSADPSTIAAADLDSRARVAAAEAKEARTAANAAAGELVRAHNLVPFRLESAKLRAALAEAARAKLLADFSSAKLASERLAAALEAQIAPSYPFCRLIPPSVEASESVSYAVRAFKRSRRCELLRGC